MSVRLLRCVYSQCVSVFVCVCVCVCLCGEREPAEREPGGKVEEAILYRCVVE